MNKQKAGFYIGFVLGMCVLAFYFGTKKANSSERYSETRSLMGTFVRIDVCMADNDGKMVEKAVRSAWKRMEEVSMCMSAFNPESSVSRINNSYLEPVGIEKDLHNLIREAFAFNRLTGGAFDITVKPLMELWKNAYKAGAIPSRQAIIETQELMGEQNIRILDESRIAVAVKGAKIDLGAIAKGYAVDEAVRILKNGDLKNFYIDAGGDLFVQGHNCEGNLWKIGVRDPQKRSNIIDIIELTDAAVTTSGNYEQSYEIEGKKYSHIINPVTGYPQEEVISATVIAPTAREADALSTALCVMGPEQGTTFFDSLGNDYACLIITSQEDSDVLIRKSVNYQKFQLLTK